MRLRSESLVLLALAGASLAACHKKPPAQTPTPTVTTSAPPPMIDRGPPAAPPTTVTRPTGPTEAEKAAEATRMRNTIGQPIYFDYQKDELRDDSRAALDAKIPLLQRFPGVRIRISGHTDDRGSDEYNLALGQRRAAAAKRYLGDRGINASRVDVVSYGEERPAAMGENEGSWSKNRRDEFEIVAGADQVKPGANH